MEDTYDLHDFAAALSEVYGEIIAMQEECPGIYYVSARRDEAELFGQEYYIMDKRSPALSDKAKAYGQPVAGLPGCRVSFPAP